MSRLLTSTDNSESVVIFRASLRVYILADGKDSYLLHSSAVKFVSTEAKAIKMAAILARKSVNNLDHFQDYLDHLLASSVSGGCNFPQLLNEAPCNFSDDNSLGEDVSLFPEFPLYEHSGSEVAPLVSPRLGGSHLIPFVDYNPRPFLVDEAFLQNFNHISGKLFPHFHLDRS